LINAFVRVATAMIAEGFGPYFCRICSAEYIRLVDQRTAMLDLILSKSLFVRPLVP